MQQTMMRVKDPVKSLEFYCNVLGFRLIHYSEVRRKKMMMVCVAAISCSLCVVLSLDDFVISLSFIIRLLMVAVPTMEV